MAWTLRRTPLELFKGDPAGQAPGAAVADSRGAATPARRGWSRARALAAHLCARTSVVDFEAGLNTAVRKLRGRPRRRCRGAESKRGDRAAAGPSLHRPDRNSANITIPARGGRARVVRHQGDPRKKISTAGAGARRTSACLETAGGARGASVSWPLWLSPSRSSQPARPPVRVAPGAAFRPPITRLAGVAVREPEP